MWGFEALIDKFSLAVGTQKPMPTFKEMKIAWMGFLFTAVASLLTPEIVNWGLCVIFEK